MKKLLLSTILFVAPLISFGAVIDFPNPLGNASFGVILSKVLVIAMWVGGVILTVLVVWAAYTLMLSKGDPGEIKKAKATILYGIIGYVILLFAEAIRRIIVNLLT
ncbi:MAG: hypothetical protein LiPW41_111 [Parcubacteria group bacterium LiPW_41]|nr:MAG: hypothetical protein LiPW41_111 [Parcubacteria group bacterium LiPW_41]